MLIGTSVSAYASGYSAYVVGERKDTESTLFIHVEPSPALQRQPRAGSEPARLLDIYA